MVIMMMPVMVLLLVLLFVMMVDRPTSDNGPLSKVSPEILPSARPAGRQKRSLCLLPARRGYLWRAAERRIIGWSEYR